MFEPAGDSSDYFMNLTHRDLAFRNIAMADYDILLCGHKHAHDFQAKSFGDLFDNRANYRLLLNYFRRLIGIHSLPMQYVDDSGRFWSKLYSLFINYSIIAFKLSKNNSHDIKEADVLKFLTEFLDKPDSIEPALKKYILNYQFKGEMPITKQEIKEIQKYINIHLSYDKRKKMKDALKEFNKVIKEFKNRPFLQIMSGSATKAMGYSSKKRSFNEYTISKVTDGYKIESFRNIWDDTENNFVPHSLHQEQSFKLDNKKRIKVNDLPKSQIITKFSITLDASGET